MGSFQEREASVLQMMDKRHPLWFPCMVLLKERDDLQWRIDMLTSRTSMTDADRHNLEYHRKRFDQVTIALVLLDGGKSQV